MTLLDLTEREAALVVEGLEISSLWISDEHSAWRDEHSAWRDEIWDLIRKIQTQRYTQANA